MCPPRAGLLGSTLSGLHVFPGMFDALSSHGLVEIGSVPATNDQAEMGAYNPHLEAATAVHPASEVIPVTRANGVTHTLVAPASGRDGVIAGQAAVLNLAGWTVEEMAIEPATALVVTWPRIRTRRFDFSTFSVVETPYREAKEKAEEAVGALRDWVDAARHYKQAAEAGSERLGTDQKLAALSACLDGEMPVIVRANAKRDIEAAIEFAGSEGLRMILAGGREAWKVKETARRERHSGDPRADPELFPAKRTSATTGRSALRASWSRRASSSRSPRAVEAVSVRVDRTPPGRCPTTRRRRSPSDCRRTTHYAP